jgi:hypothetical protein
MTVTSSLCDPAFAGEFENDKGSRVKIAIVNLSSEPTNLLFESRICCSSPEIVIRVMNLLFAS